MTFRISALSFMFVYTSVVIAVPLAYLDPNLSFDARVDDLVSRMTLDEKVSQMLNDAPAIPRLNVPAYNWWNEALHGVARNNIATVFPQAIGLAATWNTDLHLRIATAISDEARAKYHEALRTGHTSIYSGLTFWSPNINIFRDPRWGRGQETYGEDPYMAGRFGVAFVKGLQGDDPKYLKTVATPKHFAVHSGPEILRHKFDTPVSEYDLWDTYLPAFEACVREAKCFSVMSAYNRFNNQPCTGSYRLLTKILRGKWGFTGYVVSDCDAVGDIYTGHKTVATAEEAAAMSVKAGCELNCGTTYSALTKAVEKGLITEKEIDAAVKKLFMARFHLGMFDPPPLARYSQIPFSVNDSPAHDELARQAACQSMVLLKNDAKTLPLKKNLKTVAVIGPNADSVGMLLGNYNGDPSHPVTILQGIKQALEPNTTVLYVNGCPLVDDHNALQDLVPDYVFFTDANCTNKGIKAEYFDNMELKGKPVLSRIDKWVWFEWGWNAPSPQVPADGFSVRWTGVLVAPKTATYYMSIESDDGQLLYLNNKLVTQRWSEKAGLGDVAEIKLEKGQILPVRVEFFENKEAARIKLKWSVVDAPELDAAVDAARRADAVILVMGISPRLENEEMCIKCDGFDSGDRTNIELPKVQQQLMEKVCAVGKPAVLVLTTGSALSINWAQKNVPAILLAWYPGQRGGSAVADVLFGDYNPAGRLPITFYKSINDLPAFDDYNMAGRTYRYFKGQPLYSFGYGLSYTEFAYDNLEILHSKETVTARITVKNIGDRDGDEVVQLYIRPVDGSPKLPLRALRDFKRIELKAGQKQTVEFNLSPQRLMWIDEKGNQVSPEKIIISIGDGKKFKEKTISLK
jgi:beta-glucosidase